MNHEAQCATDRLKHALKKTTLLPLKLRNTNGRKRLAVQVKLCDPSTVNKSLYPRDSAIIQRHAVTCLYSRVYHFTKKQESQDRTASDHGKATFLQFHQQQYLSSEHLTVSMAGHKVRNISPCLAGSSQHLACLG